MKKLLMLLMLCLSIAWGNDASHFRSKDGYIGGVVDRNIIYIYPGNKAYKMSSKTELSILESVARNQLCKDKETKKLINIGYEVIFVYISRGFYQATAVTVDSCK